MTISNHHIFSTIYLRVICLNKTELTEYLVKDKPPDLDFDGNAGMLGSTINITSFENIPAVAL